MEWETGIFLNTFQKTCASLNQYTCYLYERCVQQEKFIPLPKEPLFVTTNDSGRRNNTKQNEARSVTNQQLMS